MISCFVLAFSCSSNIGKIEDRKDEIEEKYTLRLGDDGTYFSLGEVLYDANTIIVPTYNFNFDENDFVKNFSITYSVSFLTESISNLELKKIICKYDNAAKYWNGKNKDYSDDINCNYSFSKTKGLNISVLSLQFDSYSDWENVQM